MNYHVIAEDGTITQKAPYTDKGARVFLYAKTDRLVWESRMEDIIQILFHMKASACSMSFVTWISASGI